MRRFPFFAPACASPRMAQLSASLPPEVKYSSSGAQPSRAAMRARQSLSSFCAACPSL